MPDLIAERRPVVAVSALEEECALRVTTTEAETRFIVRHDALLARVARPFVGGRLNAELDDLLQEGRIAILLCLRGGYPLDEPYLATAARNEMRRHLRSLELLSRADPFIYLEDAADGLLA